MAYDPWTEFLVATENLQHAWREHLVTHFDGLERAVWRVWPAGLGIDLGWEFGYERWLYNYTVANDEPWRDLREGYY